MAARAGWVTGSPGQYLSRVIESRVTFRWRGSNAATTRSSISDGGGGSGSGAGTNLKVGEALVRHESGGHRSGVKRRKKIFGGAPPLFWLEKYN